MLDCVTRWDEDKVWQGASVAAGAIEATRITLPGQYIVSGNLSAFAALSGADANGAGALGLVTGETYTVRLARDRMLFVGALPESITEGWNASGFAVSAVSSSYAVFEFSGSRIRDLIATATTLDCTAPGPSASVGFAGLPAILYCYTSPGRLRLHIERGFAAYLRTWLNSAF